MTLNNEENDELYDDFIAALDLLPDLIILKDAQRRWVRANKRAQEVFGVDEDEYRGKRDEDLAEYYPNFQKFLPDYLASDLLVWETGERVKAEEVILINGEEHLFEVIKTPFFHSDGEPKGMVVTCRDITERENTKKALAESEEKYRIILEHTTDLIAVFDVHSLIIYASPSYESILGFSPKQLIGTDGTAIVHPEDTKVAKEKLMKVFLEGKARLNTLRFKGEGDNWLWIEANLQPVIHDGTVTAVISLSRNITKRKEVEDQLKYMAYHDLLTGAGNRRLLLEQLQETIAAAKSNDECFCVMALDFDRFKWVNDTLGHDIGDELLSQFVKRISDCLRSVDTLYRIGGDEFMILLPCISSQKDVIRIANCILVALQEPWKISGYEFITTTSIGIAEFPKCGDNVSLIMKCADQALYKAKQAGRNNYQIYNPKTYSIESKDIIVNQIKKALEQNEFYMVYQPKYNFSTKEIESAEALIRWNHPQKGLRAPDDFIPLAEEYNLIIPITKWVLQHISLQIKNWEHSGYKPIPISVNVSVKHFEPGSSLVEDVKTILDQTGLNPNLLILEVAENITIKYQERVVQIIQQLKEMGIKIAIDDFGKGFSSLSSLEKLPLDLLNLDKTFIEERKNQNTIPFLHSIVNLAHTLNLIVVAEGIETESEYQVLQQIGCDIGQGYFFSKPLMAHEFQQAFLEKDATDSLN